MTTLRLIAVLAVTAFAAHAASQNIYEIVLKDVPGARSGSDRILEISFYAKVPPPKVVDKIVHDSLEQAASFDGTRDILVMAFLGEEALTDTQYSGELDYQASDRKTVTLEEYRKSPHSANF
jgi:phosphoribosyl-AMP cyclohydrolase